MNDDRLKKIVDRLAEKKVKQDIVKEKYAKKGKGLSTAERLTRIEEFLGL